MENWPRLLARLENGLLQRDVATRAMLLAVLAGEHVLLLGPPGTAKSELARRLRTLLPGAHYFERLLTRFTVPEELFGPLSLRALEEDRYERLTQGFLPTAEVAFLDEVFKANSSILNTLLGLLHERQFDNGTQRADAPLVCLIGASNELPDDESLQAFYDRFLLRVPVQPVDEDHFRELLTLESSQVIHDDSLSQAERAQIQHRSAGVLLTSEVLGLLQQARQRCSAKQITVSDRRWRQIAHLLKVQAASRNADAVTPWDLWILPYVLPESPDQVDEEIGAFMLSVAGLTPFELQGLERATEAFAQQLEIETRAPADPQDDAAGKLALAQSMASAGHPSDMHRLLSERAQRRYSPIHVTARTDQIDDVLTRTKRLRETLETTSEASLLQARSHPWLPPSWLQRIDSEWTRRRNAIETIEQRLLESRAGFIALPTTDQATASTPEPVRWQE